MIDSRITPEDLAAIRERHTPRVKVAVEECRVCASDWPCDAARALAEIDRLRVLWLMGLRAGRAGARAELRARVAAIPDVPIYLDGSPIAAATGVIARVSVTEALDGLPVWVDEENA